MGWLWTNVPLMIVFFLCWSAIPLYLVLTRWHREVEARHAEVAAWHAQLSARDGADTVRPCAGSGARAGKHPDR